MRTKSARPDFDDENLMALAGKRVFVNEFDYAKGTEVFGEGERADYVYQITFGAVRTYKLLSDGRRQINSFHLPGDIFGLENNLLHRFTAEAIVATKALVMKRRSIFDAAPNGIWNKSLLHLVTRNLRHAENHMLLLGRKTSHERVAAFILEMDERLGYPMTMVLPMNRQDIADYLGLTLETVSRSFSVLRDEQLLRFEGSLNHREIRLLDRERLAALDSGRLRFGEGIQP